MPDPLTIRIRDWKEFQHFKDRAPIWIKLYRRLRHKREWRTLSGDAAKLLIDLWMLASEGEYQGDINLLSTCLAWEIRMETPEAIAAMVENLQTLVALEFIDADIGAISARYQVDIPRALAREETEKRERQRREKNAAFRGAISTEPEIEVGNGSSMAANELLARWIDNQPTEPDPSERRRQGGKAKRLCEKHPRIDIAQAFVGMGYLYPYSDGTPWDLFDLEAKFSKAKAAAMKHPEIECKRREDEILAELRGGGT